VCAVGLRELWHLSWHACPLVSLQKHQFSAPRSHHRVHTLLSQAKPGSGTTTIELTNNDGYTRVPLSWRAGPPL
jgi:hypothetical protein